MVKHKALCWLTALIIFIGCLNWGLVGLSGLLKIDSLNLVSMIFSTIPTLEYIIYLVVGVAGIVYAYFTLTNKDCGCMKK